MCELLESYVIYIRVKLIIIIKIVCLKHLGMFEKFTLLLRNGPLCVYKQKQKRKKKSKYSIKKMRARY